MIPFLGPANKDARTDERGSERRVGTYHASTCHLVTFARECRRSVRNQRRSLSRFELAPYCRVVGPTRKLPFLDLRARAPFLYLGFYVRRKGRGCLEKRGIMAPFLTDY